MRHREAKTRAILFSEHGGVDKLRLEDVPIPEPGPTDVLVEVHACGINRLDLIAREGRVGAPAQLPHIPMRTVLNLVAAGKLRPVIDRALPLERAAEAQRLMEERQHFGKLILNP